MGVGAPVGNKNGARGTRWRAAIERAIEAYPEPVNTENNNDKMRGINMAAMAFVNKMILDQDIQFFKEFGDRLDGKAVATTEVTGKDGAPLQVAKIERTITDPSNTNT